MNVLLEHTSHLTWPFEHGLKVLSSIYSCHGLYLTIVSGIMYKWQPMLNEKMGSKTKFPSTIPLNLVLLIDIKIITSPNQHKIDFFFEYVV